MFKVPSPRMKPLRLPPTRPPPSSVLVPFTFRHHNKLFAVLLRIIVAPLVSVIVLFVVPAPKAPGEPPLPPLFQTTRPPLITIFENVFAPLRTSRPVPVSLRFVPATTPVMF